MIIYKWQKSADSGITWTDIDGGGADTAEVAVAVTEDASRQLFRCMVSNDAGTAFSDCVRIVCVDAPPRITVQPADATADTGEEISFTVAALQAQTYLWQVSGDYGGTWTDTAATGDTLTVGVSAASAAVLYRCAVSNPAGTSYSEAAMLTPADAPPVIMAQPVDASGRSGERVTFTVVANGADSFLWEWKRDDQTAWTAVPVSTATRATLSVVAGTGSVRYAYRCAAANANGTTYTDEVNLILTE